MERGVEAKHEPVSLWGRPDCAQDFVMPLAGFYYIQEV